MGVLSVEEADEKFRGTNEIARRLGPGQIVIENYIKKLCEDPDFAEALVSAVFPEPPKRARRKARVKSSATRATARRM